MDHAPGGPLQDPTGLYAAAQELLGDPDLKGLPMLMGFTGFADAGHAVEQITAELLREGTARTVAEFDVDALIDYRARRPRITFSEDHLEDYSPPRLALYALVDGLGQQYLLLAGPEPDFQWERFARAVVDLVEKLDVRLVLWTHSIPMPVPHTRPLGVTVHGNRPDLVDGISRWKPIVSVPAAIGHLLELRLSGAGRGVVGFVVHTPHYLSEAEYPASAVTALEHLGAAASLMLPTDRLREANREIERQIADQVAGSDDVRELVEGLEERFDERSADAPQRSLLAAMSGELPDAEVLGAAVEAYLASQEETKDGDADDGHRGGAAPAD
ncbi:proteasome assembly chaperone family protein [Sinomonas susongensis]|uniref:proteasome assembly chaperone family protein n=1 Tax=Sinomonas susongensis TaxID=1324851 RepID=UPI001109130A|nr:PAC2 family protein [Sinomonas susongensis]